MFTRGVVLGRHKDLRVPRRNPMRAEEETGEVSFLRRPGVSAIVGDRASVSFESWVGFHAFLTRQRCFAEGSVLM